jgi:hypothetical protein
MKTGKLNKKGFLVLMAVASLMAPQMAVAQDAQDSYVEGHEIAGGPSIGTQTEGGVVGGDLMYSGPSGTLVLGAGYNWEQDGGSGNSAGMLNIRLCDSNISGMCPGIGALAVGSVGVNGTVTGVATAGPELTVTGHREGLQLSLVGGPSVRGRHWGPERAAGSETAYGEDPALAGGADSTNGTGSCVGACEDSSDAGASVADASANPRRSGVDVGGGAGLTLRFINGSWRIVAGLGIQLFPSGHPNQPLDAIGTGFADIALALADGPVVPEIFVRGSFAAGNMPGGGNDDAALMAGVRVAFDVSANQSTDRSIASDDEHHYADEEFDDEGSNGSYMRYRR